MPRPVTLGVALALVPRLGWLAVGDLVAQAYAVINRAETLVARRGGWTSAQDRLWWLPGLDRFVHHLTGLVSVLALLLL